MVLEALEYRTDWYYTNRFWTGLIIPNLIFHVSKSKIWNSQILEKTRAEKWSISVLSKVLHFLWRVDWWQNRCLMLDAWCLMLDAWTPARPIHKGFHKGGAAEGRPLFVEAAEGIQASSMKHEAWSMKHQASSIKPQASSIKHQASSSKHQALRNWALDSGKKLRNLAFPDLSVSYERISSRPRGVYF